MPEENVVALIVKRHATFPLKLRFVMEQGRQHTSHCVTQSSGKVVENHFGAEGGDLTPVFLDVFSNFDIAETEMGGGPIG